MEREHVSILMCRKLCGCKSGRIDDDKEPSPSGSTYSIINPGHDPVCVLVASHRIIARGLLGALLAGLEEKGLRSNQFTLLVPSLEQARILYGRTITPSLAPLPVSSWSGPQLYKEMLKGVTDFCARFAVDRGELYVSENKANGRKDHKLWFGAPVITSQPGVIVEEPVVAEAKEGPIAEHPAEIEVQNHLPAADEELVQDLGDALPEEMPEAKDAETPAVVIKKEETAA